ncbi:MAG: GNAT family N-acetyltransferase [Nitriliruptor sp.]
MTVTVRDLAPYDEDRWRELWAGYLSFYEHQLDETVTAATWHRLLAETDGMGAQVAVDADGQVVGLVHHVVHAGTWSTAPRCYLEDLFVDPSARGRGVGRALIEATADRAHALGCDELYWITGAENRTARRLYDQLATLTPYVRYEAELPR